MVRATERTGQRHRRDQLAGFQTVVEMRRIPRQTVEISNRDSAGRAVRIDLTPDLLQLRLGDATPLAAALALRELRQALDASRIRQSLHLSGIGQLHLVLLQHVVPVGVQRLAQPLQQLGERMHILEPDNTTHSA